MPLDDQGTSSVSKDRTMKRNLIVESKGTDSPLDPGFEPGEHDVICSRGKQYYNHIGNIRFRALIQDQVERYCRAENKVAKSRIVMSIVNEVRSASPAGGFVRFSLKRGCYVEIGDELAREKVGHALRERRKCGKQRLLGSPQTTVSEEWCPTRVESIGPQGAKAQQWVHSRQGEESKNEMSILQLFSSGYTRDRADTGHQGITHDLQITTASAVANVLDMASEEELDGTDLPDNFDIDSIF